MANATWPATLPSYPLVEGYEERAPATMLRTEMDAGPAKVRRRFTAGVRVLTLEVGLTTEQTETLDAFFVDTLQGGTLPFDWVHPRTQDPATFRFTAEPEYEPLGGEMWIAVLPLEILP